MRKITTSSKNQFVKQKRNVNYDIVYVYKFEKKKTKMKTMRIFQNHEFVDDNNDVRCVNFDYNV